MTSDSATQPAPPRRRRAIRAFFGIGVAVALVGGSVLAGRLNEPTPKPRVTPPVTHTFLFGSTTGNATVFVVGGDVPAGRMVAGIPYSVTGARLAEIVAVGTRDAQQGCTLTVDGHPYDTEFVFAPGSPAVCVWVAPG